MKNLFIFVIFVLMSASAFAGLPAPGAFPKNGDCPSGYLAKGKECEPAKDARYAVAKTGDCPEAYEAEGNYCLATPNAKLAIRRAAMTCPKGFTPIGDYCISEN